MPPGMKTDFNQAQTAFLWTGHPMTGMMWVIKMATMLDIGMGLEPVLRKQAVLNFQKKLLLLRNNLHDSKMVAP